MSDKKGPADRSAGPIELRILRGSLRPFDLGEIDLEAHPPIEFEAWRWGRLDEVCDLIVPFKRPAYEQVVAAFARFAA